LKKLRKQDQPSIQRLRHYRADRAQEGQVDWFEAAARLDGQ
jgi:hypothetical protein